MLPHQTIRSDTGQSPLAQSPTPFDDDSDDSGAPTVIADSDTGQLDSELDIGLDYLTPFTAVGTVGSRQGDVAEVLGPSQTCANHFRTNQAVTSFPGGLPETQ